MISDELRWCKNFLRAITFRSHRKARVRKKNAKRVNALNDYALKRWGFYPYPPEWKKQDEAFRKSKEKEK